MKPLRFGEVPVAASSGLSRAMKEKKEILKARRLAVTRGIVRKG